MNFKNLSIKYKLIFFSCITAFVALSLMAFVFVLYNWNDYKKSLYEDVESLSEIIASNCQASLMFNDQESASEILSSLKFKPYIISAVLYDAKNKQFVKYGSSDCKILNTSFYGKYLYYYKKIYSDNEKVGSICLKASLSQIYNKFYNYIILTICVLIIALIITTFLALKLQKTISQPILKIVNIAKKVYSTKDYSLRVEEEPRNDELGILIKSFNSMLSEIQSRDSNLEFLIYQRTKELEEAIEHLKELDRMKSEFLSNVSHELRTPLTSVRGFASIIKKDFEKKILPYLNEIKDKKVERTSNRILDNLKIIISEGKRLTNLINDVLDLAKIESGKIEFKKEQVNLEEVLDEAAKTIELLAKEKGLYLKKEIEGNDFNIIGDRERLIQVATNLFGNALKFTEKGGITYRIKEKENEVICEIEDTGCGIPEDMIEQIFEKFKQVGDTLTEKPQGTGLGLPICKEIIKNHNGKIWAESEVGKGSKFIFVIHKKNKEKTEENRS